MAEASRYTFAGPASGKVKLPDEWFGAEVNKSAVYQATRAQRTNDRAGTASTKTRALVRGGGAKPWRQKGTGRARAGSNRSPLWKGGGTVFGPIPKDWHERVPQKVRRIAFASALSDKAAEGLVRAREGVESTRAEVERGREVAERHALELLDPLWAPVLDPLARR